jgi:hypothetical protein
MNTIMKKIITPLSIAFISIAFISIAIVSTALAHDDHDHDGPSSFQPQKGGVVKSTEYVNIEVVNKDTNLEIYAYDMEGKIKDNGTYNLKAGMKLPKSKKVEKLKLDSITDSSSGKFSHYQISNKPKNTHRYSLVLEIKDSKEAHADKVEFTIELKK